MEMNGERSNEEITLSISGYFPHEPGPITRSDYKTYKKTVISADILEMSGYNYVSAPTVKVSGNSVIMTASFQAQWDVPYGASVKVLVTLGS